MTFAIIVGGVVRDIVSHDPMVPGLDARDVSAVQGVAPGWLVDGNGAFSAPGADPGGPPLQPRFSFLEFMDLFTPAEQLAIAGAAMTDVPTKLWYDRAVGAQYIDLGDTRLGAGLQAMVDAELLTAERRDRVLAGLPPED